MHTTKLTGVYFPFSLCFLVWCCGGGAAAAAVGQLLLQQCYHKELENESFRKNK